MANTQRPALKATRIYLRNPDLLPFLILGGVSFLAYMIYPKAFSSDDIGATLIFMAALAFAVACIGWIVLGFRRGNNLLRAVRHGQPVLAHVDQIYETRIRQSGQQHAYCWTMTRKDTDGDRGHAVPAAKSRFEELKPGDSLTLWQDPKSRKKFWDGDL